MKRPLFRAMSLLSLLLAACFGKKPPEPPKEYPRFPESDAANVKIERVELDSGFLPRAFFVATDKQNVYVLGYKTHNSGNPDMPGQLQRTDMRVFALDAAGKIVHRLDMKKIDDIWGASLGLLDNELLVRAGDCFHVINTSTFTVQEKIPVYDEQFFPTKQNITLMTPDEQRDAYEKLYDAALKNCSTCLWLDWSFAGKYYVLAQGAPGKRAVWSPMSYEDDVIASLKQRFKPAHVSLNANASADSGGGHYTIVDGPIKIREADILSGGTELDYPNYKSRSVIQYEATVGAKVAHFSTTDKKRHDLRLGFADNLYLATHDGAAWVKHEGVLYRMQ